MFVRTLQPPSERETPVSMTKALHPAQLALSVAIRRRFSAMQTSFPFAPARCKPRRLNWSGQSARQRATIASPMACARGCAKDQKLSGSTRDSTSMLTRTPSSPCRSTSPDT